MKSIGCIALVVSCSCFSQGENTPQYVLRHIEPQPGYTRVYAFKINSHGDATLAQVSDAGVEHYSIWKSRSGEVIELSPPDGVSVTSLLDINDEDEVIGTSTGGPFLWSSRSAWMYFEIPEGVDLLTPLRINKRGHVMGIARKPGFIEHPYSWDSGSGGKVYPATDFIPADLNSGDVVAGNLSNGAKGIEAALFDDGRTKPLGDLPGGSRSFDSRSVAINDRNFVLGMCAEGGLGPGHVPCLWRPEQGMVDLTFSATFSSVGLDNENRALVNDRANLSSFLFVSGSGKLRLEELIETNGVTLSNLLATSLDRTGPISGYATCDGMPCAVTLIPK